MVTSNESTGQWWSDLPLYAEGIPASLSVKQVVAKVKKILATCGLGYDKPLANYDPNTQSWKMSEGIFPLGEQPSLPILPPSGMTRNGALFQQPAWVPITDATASSSWPTPTTQDHIQRRSTQQKPGSRHSMGLGDAVRMWPTPRNCTAMAATITPESAWNPKRFPNLETMVGRAMWPTPTAVTRPMEGNVRLYRAKVEAGEMTEAEAEAILGKSVWEAQGKLKAQWPTPTHGKLAGGQGAFNRVQELYSEGTITDEERKAMQAGNGGKLNPMWVEWLMGFPPGWTALED